jgi:hypothetical protein
MHMVTNTHRRQRLMRALAFAILSAVLPGATFAWNKAGHMTSAAIAHDDLAASDPALVARVVAILRQHPQFDQRWKAAVDAPDIAPEEANRRLFMLAARWPDDVRGDSDFDHPEDHFIDLPYKPPGQPASVKVAQVPEENLVTAYADHLATLSTSADEEAKAVALCWIFHLTGDVHQPLHTVSMFTTKFPIPEGDRGGTRFYIRVNQNTSTISLHSFWDGLVLGSERYKAVADTATELRLRQGFARADLPELAQHPFGPTAADTWARQESFPIAKSVAYRAGKLKSGSKSNGVALPSGYAADAKSTAERRMVLSGYRIADVMRAVFPQP